MVEISADKEKKKLFGERPEKEEKSFTFSKVLCVLSDLILVYCLFLTTYSVFNYFRILNEIAMLPEGSAIQPDLSFLAYLLPAAFVFAGLTHTFYYNKERFANCIKIRFEYIKQLLMFKLNSGLYDQETLIGQVDCAIEQAENEADALLSNDIQSAEQEHENISV